MISIFTENFFLSGKIKNVIKKVTGRGGRGPEAVLNSITKGLTELNVEFELNKNFKQPINTAYVLSGVKTLFFLIEHKKKGKIKKLIAGPNLVYTPKDFGGVLASPEVDICLVPSEQVKVAYLRHNPKLLNKIFVWYAGVNESFWKPENIGKKYGSILLYCKNCPKDLVTKTQRLIKSLDYKVIVINYGKYSVAGYKAALEKSCAAVFLSPSESQGIALAEAWSMNVPTLVWNPKKQNPHFKDMVDSPAPYLTESTGIFWENLNELKNILTQINTELPKFRPREWVLKNMTNKVSAQLFLDLIKN